MATTTWRLFFALGVDFPCALAEAFLLVFISNPRKKTSVSREELTLLCPKRHQKKERINFKCVSVEKGLNAALYFSFVLKREHSSNSYQNIHTLDTVVNFLNIIWGRTSDL